MGLRVRDPISASSAAWALTAPLKAAIISVAIIKVRRRARANAASDMSSPKKTSARERGRHKRLKLYRLGWQDDNWLAGKSPQALRPVRLKISIVQVTAEMPSFEAYSLTPAASRLATRVQGSPHLVDAVFLIVIEHARKRRSSHVELAGGRVIESLLCHAFFRYPPKSRPSHSASIARRTQREHVDQWYLVQSSPH